MKVYLIRNFRSKAIIGIYWSRSLNDLWWEVDGLADPSAYEYVTMPHGSLHFAGEEPIVEQVPDTDDEAVLDDFSPKPLPWNNATPSENLWSALHNAETMKWSRFPYSDQPGGGIHQVIAAVGSGAEKS
jgi:hypothetical protein